MLHVSRETLPLELAVADDLARSFGWQHVVHTQTFALKTRYVIVVAT